MSRGRPSKRPWVPGELRVWRRRLREWMVRQGYTALDLEKLLGYNSRGLLVRMYLGELETSRPPSSTFRKKVKRIGFDPNDIMVHKVRRVLVDSDFDLPVGTRVLAQPKQCPECVAEAKEGKRPMSQTWYVYPYANQIYCCVAHRRAWYRRIRESDSKSRSQAER